MGMMTLKLLERVCSTFVVGTGVSKAIIEDTGAADTVFED